jgi:hypothetical protein
MPRRIRASSVLHEVAGAAARTSGPVFLLDVAAGACRTSAKTMLSADTDVAPGFPRMAS